MRPKLISILFLAATAVAQQPPPRNASVSGVVREAGSGKLLAGYMISTNVNATWVDNTIIMNSSTKTVQATTDEHGGYKLVDLPPGDYRVVARNSASFGAQLTRQIALAGRDLENIDFVVSVPGVIEGKVIDEHREPVPGMSVVLVTREYFLGRLGYFLRGSGRTNDRGEYTIARVDPGRPYFLVAEQRIVPRLPAHSESPLNPKLRRRVPIRTWYPNSPAKEGAAALTLRSGERREGVDIEVKKSPSYCIDGVIETPAGPAPMQFSIEALQPSSGISSSGGMYMTSPSGSTPDGKFRVCGFYPGAFRFSARQENLAPNQPTAAFAAAVITISDRDLTNLRIIATPSLAVEGEVVLEGAQPDPPLTTKVSVWLEPLLRTRLNGEESIRVEIPSKFNYPPLFVDDFYLNATFIGPAPGLYVRETTYAGRSVRYESIRPGSAVAGDGLRIVVARDGATINAVVSNKDNNPIPDARVVIVPADVSSEPILAGALITGQTGPAGRYTSRALAPGKYYVAATEDTVNATPESTAKIWRARRSFKEVDLTPSGNAEVKLELIKLE